MKYYEFGGEENVMELFGLKKEKNHKRRKLKIFFSFSFETIFLIFTNMINS